MIHVRLVSNNFMDMYWVTRDTFIGHLHKSGFNDHKCFLEILCIVIHKYFYEFHCRMRVQMPTTIQNKRNVCTIFVIGIALKF